MLQYQRLFKSRITKAIIFLSVLPIILVTPLIKISGKFLGFKEKISSKVLLSTIFNQLVTHTTGASYDPKRHQLINITDSSDIARLSKSNRQNTMICSFNRIKGPLLVLIAYRKVVKLLDNEYETRIIGWLEESKLKSLFRVRSSHCVSTVI